MTRRLPRILASALIALAVFAATALALTLARGDRADLPGAAGGAEVARLQAVLADDPDNPTALADLAHAALLEARVTGDPSWYATTEEAAERALQVAPASFRAMDALGQLALVRHRFDEALAWAGRSIAAAPGHFEAYAVRADALIELGRYDEAFPAVQRRLELRPDLPSYSRASYALELQGRREAATEVMELAVDAGAPGSEARAWTIVQLGLLRLGSGDLAGAEADMRRALAELPGDPRATAGLARVRAARGDLVEATGLYEAALDRLPLPEYAAALAEIAAARGRTADAEANVGLVRAMQALLADGGVQTDLDLAVIDADVARPSPADVARARAARAARPSVVADDALGWVLTRAGRCTEGHRVAQRSLRLGTRDALMLFHAGMAARCAGHPRQAARHLREALALNPAFSVRWAPVAREVLEELAA